MKTNAITLAFFLLVLCGGLMAQESQLQEETPTESAEEPAAEAQETTVQDAALEDSAVEDVSSNLEQPQPVAPADPQAADGSTEESRSVRRLGDMVGSGSSEFSMDIPTINAPAIDPATLPEVSLPNAQQDDVLQSLLRRQAFSPNDPEIATEMTALMNQVEADAQAALAGGNLALAQRLTDVIAEFEPDRAVIDQVATEIARRSNVASALASANAALEAGNLVAPDGNNASALFRGVLALDPGNAAAEQGLQQAFSAMLERAVGQAQELDFEAAEATLNEALAVVDNVSAVDETRANIADFRGQYLTDLETSIRQSIDQGNYDQAEGAITRLLALGHPREEINELQNLLSDARLYGSLDPGQIFNDEMESMFRPGPDLVVIPAGTFMMGSPDGEEGRFNNEGPVHRVNFERGFAISRTEITVADYELFVNATGYRTDAERVGESRIYDPRTGRMDVQPGITWRNDYIGNQADPDLPVVHVSWNDARAYVNWLGRETGRSYRLPSEAEFEYATRAGSQMPYWWGDGSPEDDTENVTGDRDSSPTNANWNVAFRRYSDGFWGPAPVASLQANPFGLYDMSGNVMEWVEDCWHDSFVRAPDDGSSWMNPGCDRHVIKGGAWSSTPAMSRSAFRLLGNADTTDMRVGFRVARDL